MKRQLKQVTLTVAGALASSLLSALLQREQRPPTQDAEARPAAAPQATASFRSGLVGLISDILAETYRKVQAAQRENRR